MSAKNKLIINEITEVSLVGKGWQPKQPGATIDFIKGTKEGGSQMTEEAKLTLSEQIKKALSEAFAPFMKKPEEGQVEKGAQIEATATTPTANVEAITKAIQAGVEPILKAVKDEAEAQVAELKKAAEAQIAIVNEAIAKANESIQKAVEAAGVEIGRMQETPQQAGNGEIDVKKANGGMMTSKDMEGMTMHDAITTLLKDHNSK